jgi:regulator of sigma E protease
VPEAVKERAPDGKDVEVGRIGISPGAGIMFVRSNPVRAIGEGVARTAEVTSLTAVGLYKIVIGQLDRRNIGGPIQIAVTAGEQARQGLPSLAFFTAVISVNLFLLNLLPVPMLDGGHLFFFVCEAVLGRPLSLRKREMAQQVGFVLLMLLMVYAFYNDLERFGVFRFLR